MYWRIYGVPKPKGSMRWVGNRMIHDNPDCPQWISDVRDQLVDREELEGPVLVVLHFLLPRGKTVRRKIPSVKPDLDKLVRAVMDALEGYCYKNDSQVVGVLASKQYAIDEDPGVHVTLNKVGSQQFVIEGW